jgi:Uma2 family endonuclease
MPVEAPRSLRWTRDEYRRMAQAGFFLDRRVELIQGDIIEMSPQDPPHAAAVRLLDYALKRIFREGFLVCVQSPLSLGLDSDPEPDLAVVKGGPRDYLGSHPDTAVLIAEVSDSSLEYDRARKGALYAEAGIQDYWIINLVDRQIEVYRKPHRDRTSAFGFGYAERAVSSPGESIVPLALPGAAIPVAEILP